MNEDRCFRMSERDLDEFRSEPRFHAFIDAYSHWILKFAPRVDDVIAQVSAAFGGTELGDGVGLFEADGIDSYAPTEEVQQLRALDERSDWTRISSADLSRCYCSPSYFDPQGFVFHLPAFLIAQLNDEHPYGFIDRLYHEERPEGWRKVLNPEQRQAIIATLELIREHPNYQDDLGYIDAAIERYKIGQ